MYDHLFSPLKLGNIQISNRICLLAHRTHFGRDGVLNDRHIAYYQRRARGGCGLIIVGEFSIYPNDRPWESLIDLHRPGVVEDLKKLTTAVHQHDTLLFAQLNHHGFQSSGHITRHAVWGPSPLSDIAFGETCKAMEPEDMDALIEAFSKAALIAKEAGFDGIEIDMGPESLLRQFLSPISNHRGDQYGGSIENRMRLPLQVVEDVRKSVGKDFTVGVCLCADEKFWGGITLESSVPMAQSLEKTGWIDFINVAVGTYYNLHMIMPSKHIPDGFTIETAAEIKNAISLPVIASHQIGFPKMADTLISENKADAAGFVRPMICDPDMAIKAKEGRTEGIRLCARDNKGCIGRVNQSKALGCIQNPEVGNEPLHDTSATQEHHTKTDKKTGTDASLSQPIKKKRVMVIGAGPAGMEAAREAHMRGHEVAIFEKEEKPGGQVNLISKRPGRESMDRVVHYLQHMLNRLEVPIHTCVTVTPELVLEHNPDVVIVATGSRPVETPYPGEYGPPEVITGPDAILGIYPMGEKILFIDEDGGHHSMATAELLVGRGKKVDIVTSDLFIGIELAPRGELYLGRQRLLQHGVTFITDVDILEINRNKIKARDIYTNEPIFFDGYDTIVLDVGNQADDALYKAIKELKEAHKGEIEELYRIGDCVAPRGIDMAIIEGRVVGEKL